MRKGKQNYPSVPFSESEAGTFKHNHKVAVVMTHQSPNVGKIKTKCGAIYDTAKLSRTGVPAVENDSRYASLPLGPGWPVASAKAPTMPASYYR